MFLSFLQSRCVGRDEEPKNCKHFEILLNSSTGRTYYGVVAARFHSDFLGRITIKSGWSKDVLRSE